MTDELRNLVLFLVILTLAAMFLALGYYFAVTLLPHLQPGPPPPGFSCPLCHWV